MIRYECDKCGLSMEANDQRRYLVRLEVYAAVGHVELDADADQQPEKSLEGILADLANADPDEIEDQTYRLLRFDLCSSCRQKLLIRPLG